MIRSRVFVFLAIALFLAGCLCAEETAAPSAPDNPKDKAEEKVTELQGLTAKVLGDAKGKSSEAERVKTNVNDQKRKAENAELAVRTAAAEITAGNRKEEADAVVKTAAEELGKCNNLYEDANNKAETASVSLNAFVTRARTLDDEAKTKIVPTSDTAENYAQVIASAAASKDLTTILSGEIDASRDLSEAQTALFAFSNCAKKIEVFKYQAESIAIVSRIETALKTAETDIQNIQQNKDGIDTIVQAMKTKCESAPDTSKSSLSSLCTTANSQLQTATTKLQEAKQCNTVMQGRKTQLDATLATLATLKDTTEEDMEKGEAANVKGHEEFIDGELRKIKAALGEVKNALSSANDVQQQMKDALDKTSVQPIDAHLDTTEQTKSTPLTDKQTQNPKDGNSELLNNDKLRNITKDVTNNPLIGGEVPTRSAANDSAVTVFIPLLVILVISAVLH